MKRMAKVAIGVGVLALAGSGIAWGAIPDSDDSEYHACVQNTASSLKAVYMLDKEAGNCPAGFTEKTWNQVGQQGPAGPQGEQGEAGEAAPTPHLVITTETLPTPPGGGVVSDFWTCPEGSVAVGISWKFATNSASDARMTVIENQINPNGNEPREFHVKAWIEALNGTNGQGDFEVFGHCMTGVESDGVS